MEEKSKRGIFRQQRVIRYHPLLPKDVDILFTVSLERREKVSVSVNRQTKKMLMLLAQVKTVDIVYIPWMYTSTMRVSSPLHVLHLSHHQYCDSVLVVFYIVRIARLGYRKQEVPRRHDNFSWGRSHFFLLKFLPVDPNPSVFFLSFVVEYFHAHIIRSVSFNLVKQKTKKRR